MKKARNIVFGIIAALVLIPAAAAFIIQIPAVQTFAVRKAAAILSKDIDGEISVGHVSIAPLHTFIVKDVCLKDAQGGTIATVGKLTANLSSKSVLSRDKLIVHKVILDDASANIRYISPEETNIGHIIAQLSPEKKKEKSGKLPWDKIVVRKVRVNNLDFAMDNDFAGTEEASGIDFNHLKINGLNLKMDDISYAGTNAVSATLSSLSFKEENSGFELKDLSCRACLGPDGLKIDGLHYDDGKSSIRADCRLDFNSFKDFSSFTDSVPASIHLDRTLVDVATAKAFVKGLDGIDLKVWLSGDFEGTVGNLTAENLKIESESGETSADLDAVLTGLPDIGGTAADIDINSIETNTSDLGRILGSVIKDFKPESISKYAPGETFTLKGKLKGPLSDFNADLALSAPHYGEADVAARCSGIVGGSSGKRIAGSLSGKSLAVGRFLKDTAIGNLTFDAGLDAAIGRKLRARVENLDIHEFGFKGYNYSGINASGTYDDGNVAFKLKDSDPNLTIAAEALGKLGKKGSSTFLAANIGIDRADLAALHFDKREVCLINGNAKADIELTGKGTVLGEADITGLHGRLKEGSYNLGDLKVKAALDPDKYKINLDSKLASASYEGPESLGVIVSDVKAILARELGNILKLDSNALKCSGNDGNCKIALKTGDIKPLTAFLMPDLLIGEGTEINAELVGSEAIDLVATSPLIAIGNKYIKKLKVTAKGDGGPVRAGVKADLLQFGDFILRNNSIAADIQDNLISLNLIFDNKDKEKRNGRFFADIAFPSPSESGYIAVADIESSHIELEDCKFNIDSARISYKDKYIDVDGLKIWTGANQYLMADGVASESPNDKIGLVLKDIDVSMLNNLLGDGLKLNGVFNGTATGFGLLGKQMGLLADINASELAVNDERLGDLRILCQKDEVEDIYNLLVNNILDSRKPISASGHFKPKGKKLDLKASLDRLAVSWLDPLLTGIVTDMGGSLSGDLKVEGPLDKLKIRGDGTRFNDLACTVDFTKVPYIINGPFSIDEKGITFQNDTIADTYGHTGRVTGGVTYDCFKNIRLGVNFRLRNMQALNTTAADEDNGFYGRAFGTGTVGITGPTDKIQIDINLRTGDGAVHIPLSSSGSEKKSILTFVDNRLPVYDEFDSLIVSKKAVAAEKNSSSLGVKVKLNVTNQTEVGLDINRSLGDMLKARGTGNVEINVAPTLFDIKGGYNVEEGSYKFALMGITSKDFIINPGGTINFNGDIMQSDLDLTATYRTKASISSLIADSTSVNSRRTVNCGIGIGGKLSNPQLSFDIDIPDLDPTTQGLVQSSLSTEEKRLKQFLALLVSGSFVPDENSGIVNNTTVLYSNASEIMANQVNNIFRQLDIPLDLGFNYQPGSGGTDIFDVAISTQLFNNRVSINGNIGNQDYSASSASEVVGNVDVEIKMNKSGRLRLNLFSHAADRYSNYLDQTQRNGAGMVYQQEFDTWEEFWRKVFRKGGRGGGGYTGRPSGSFQPHPSSADSMSVRHGGELSFQ